MSEQRYTVGLQSKTIFDMKTELYLFDNKIICELLNAQNSLICEQQATNSALRTENNHLIDVIKEYAKKYEEQQATIQSLKERLYDFEKRKIIEESDIDEDVIPKVKLLRAELFGEKYE